MNKHIRSNLLLFGLSIGICCIAYPLVMLALGWTLFPSNAEGSLIRVKGPDGTECVVGSRLIAQPFTNNEYFWPRPSAASYNAAAAGASNFGASQPKLRDRVAQQLGVMVVYKAGSASAGPDPAKPRMPQDDIAAWVAAKPDRVADWANDYTVTAAGWARTNVAKDEKGDDKYGLQGEYVAAWAKDHPEAAEDWKKSNPGKEPKPEDLVGAFFTDFAKAHPGKWPGVVEKKDGDKVTKSIEVVDPDAAVAPFFFDMWLQDPANADKVVDLEPVPADIVTSSGSGLDPHITVRNAKSVYQLDRVASARAGKREAVTVRQEMIRLIEKLSFTPLGGLAGEPLVNVLELNLALDARFPMPSAGEGQMVVDELEERAADVSAPPAVDVRRAFQVLAVGMAWAIPGALIGLLAAALAAYWADLALRFGVLGTLLGTAAGVWLEAATESRSAASL